jgi:hypothetical protein
MLTLRFDTQLKCERPAYLPVRSEDVSGSPEGAVLERQFRLLREDFVGPLRQELQKELDLSKRPHGLNVRFEGVALQPRPVVLTSFILPPWHPVKRVRQWPEGIGVGDYP